MSTTCNGEQSSGLGLGLVVPTKDRPKDLLALLKNLETQSQPPQEVVIVDGSDQPVRALIESRKCSFKVEYMRHRPPSAAAQRNAGIERLKGRYPFIGLLDDDINLAPDALECMLRFWASEEARGVAGTAFCQEGQEQIGAKGWLKRSRLAEGLGLYSRTPGGVAASGWHAMVGTVTEDTPVDWLTTAAAVWRAEVFDRHRFDEYYHTYSYLEDLDFSYSVSRGSRLMIVASARYRHFDHHASHPGEWYRRFGEVEVRNRLYFVRKHRLSIPVCYLGLGVRFLQTVAEAVMTRRRVLLSRAVGNLHGFAQAAVQRLPSP